MNIGGYLEQVRHAFESGHATEHSYRPALHALFESIDPALRVINEPKKSEGGMPDFLFQRGDIPFGWAEAKDIDKDVIKLKGYSKEQRKRYEAAYPNLIYTNGVDFEFIRDGEPIHFVSIAEFLMGRQPNPERFGELERQLKAFAEQKPISIRSAAKLADMMAAKAAIIKDELEIALANDREFRSGLGGQYKAFKANLLPHLTTDEFADLYAETITYGTGRSEERQAPDDQEGGPQGPDSRSGNRHRDLPRESRAAHFRPREGVRAGQMVSLCRGRSAAASSRLRVADGELCHVPHEARHDA